MIIVISELGLYFDPKIPIATCGIQYRCSYIWRGLAETKIPYCVRMLLNFVSRIEHDYDAIVLESCFSTLCVRLGDSGARTSVGFNAGFGDWWFIISKS